MTTTDTDTLTGEERHQLSRLVGRPLRSWEWTGKPRRDEDGTYSPAIAECGACGGKWDDALTTGITPTPAARCPFEDEHEEDEDPAPTDSETLDAIHAALSGEEWNAGTIEVVAELVEASGRKIEEPTDKAARLDEAAALVAQARMMVEPLGLPGVLAPIQRAEYACVFAADQHR